MRKSDAPSKQDFSTLLIEPNALLREGLSMILTAADFRIAHSAAALDDQLLQTLRPGQPTLLVLGASLRIQETLDQIEVFRAWNAAAPVAVLIGETDLTPDNIAAVFRKGASGCLSKVTTGEALVKALELVLLGETVLSQQPLAALLTAERAADPRSAGLGGFGARPAFLTDMQEPGARRNTPPLSAQEKRILRCLVEGDSNKMIARRVDIAEATVKVHIKAILRKIRLQNRTQAAVWALNHEPDLLDHAEALPGMLPPLVAGGAPAMAQV